MATASARKSLARLRARLARPARRLQFAPAPEALEARQLMAADVSFYGVTAPDPDTGTQDLVKFAASSPNSVTDIGTITNVGAGFSIQALSRDPSTNQYYAFATDGTGGAVISRLDTTAAEATQVAVAADSIGYADGPDGFYVAGGNAYSLVGATIRINSVSDGSLRGTTSTIGDLPWALASSVNNPSPVAWGVQGNKLLERDADGTIVNQGNLSVTLQQAVGTAITEVQSDNTAYVAGFVPASGGMSEYDLFNINTIANIYSGAVTTTKVATLNQSLRGLAEIVASPTLHVTGVPTTVTAGQTYQVTVTADPGDGTTDTAYAGTVHFTSTDPAAVLPADATLLNGVGTFDVTFKTAGARSITATDTVTAGDTGTQAGITVTNAAADHYVVTGGIPATAGTTENYTVTVYDAYGNVATDVNYAAAVATTDPQAVAPATVTFSGGIGTFQATLKTAGAQTVTVSDPDVPSLNGSQAVAITPGAYAQFGITLPESLVAGITGTVAVVAQDAYGNAIISYNGPANLFDTDTQASYPTTVTLTSGMGSFLLTPITAGASILYVGNPDTQTTTSADLFVSAGTLNNLVVTVNPGYVAGTAGTVTVTAYDAYGNVETGLNDAINLSSSDPNAAFPAAAHLSEGTATFAVTFFLAGEQSVAARDAAASEITDSAAAIVSPGQTTNYVVQGPATALLGRPSTFTVTAYDAYNNLATGDSATIHFTSTDAAAVLPADVALAAGVASVTATFQTAGTQTLSAFGLTEMVAGTSAGTAVGGFIEGTVFLDTNANGVLDAGESPLAGRAVYLDLDASGAFNAGEPTAVTDPAGHFDFSGYAAGTYVVREDTTRDASFRYVVDQTATLGDGSLTIGAIPYSPVAPIPTTPGSFLGNSAGGTAAGYVRALYKTVLGRAGGDPEVASWVAAIDAGMSTGQVALGFNNSLERRTNEVASYYRNFLGREVDPGASFWVDRLMEGSTEASVVEGILGSREYNLAHADSSTFARDLYIDVLGRQGGEVETQAWVNEMAVGMSRSDVVARFVESYEANDRVVESLYNTGLHRGQDGTSDYWVGMLGSKKSAALVAACILSSDEFYQETAPV